MASCAVCGDLDKSLLLCLSHLFLSLVFLCKFKLILPGRHSSSHEEKSWQSLYIYKNKPARDFWADKKSTCWSPPPSVIV